MKKGFTLIELLGVIVLLSVILVLVMPNIINSIKKGNYEKDSYTADMLYKATDTYIKNNSYKVEKGSTYCISINKLVDDGLVESPVEYKSIDDTENTMSVKAVYNNTWNYSIVKNSECTISHICTRTTLSTKTNGLVPSGEFSPGDEYICKLSNNLTHHFYVLSTNGSKVSLIGEANLGTNGVLTTSSTSSVWCNAASNENGPVDAYSYISTNTANWTNIYAIRSFNYLDNNCPSCGYRGVFIRKGESNDYITTITNKANSNDIAFTNIKARLPLLSELTKVGCTTSNGSCPQWVGRGYYLNNSTTDSSTNAYYISSEGAITSVPVNSGNGIAPVIELYKSDLE